MHLYVKVDYFKHPPFTSIDCNVFVWKSDNELLCSLITFWNESGRYVVETEKTLKLNNLFAISLLFKLALPKILQ